MEGKFAVVVIMEGTFAVAFLSIYPCLPLVHPKEDLLSPFNVCKQTYHKLPVF